MPDEIKTWLGVLGALLGIIIIVTGILVFVRGSYNKATIEALRSDIRDYETREVAHDRELASVTSRLQTCEAEKETLKVENYRLQEMVTQKAAVEELKVETIRLRDELKAETARQHRELMGVMTSILTALTSRGSSE
jgi:cell shape-determining protein MreC